MRCCGAVPGSGLVWGDFECCMLKLRTKGGIRKKYLFLSLVRFNIAAVFFEWRLEKCIFFVVVDCLIDSQSFKKLVSKTSHLEKLLN